MALARKECTVVDEHGNIVTDAQIEVRREVPGQPLASIYSDRDGISPLGNPFAVDGVTGVGGFHVAGGAYRIRAFKDDFERIERYVAIGTAGESDADTFASQAVVDALAASVDAFAASIGCVKVSSGTLGSATSNINIALPGGYTNYRLYYTGRCSAAGDQGFNLRTGTGGTGGSFASGAADYQAALLGWFVDGGAVEMFGDVDSDSSIPLGSAEDNHIIRGYVDILNAHNTLNPAFIARFGVPTEGEQFATGERSATAAINAIRLFWDSGNHQTGTHWELYGFL